MSEFLSVLSLLGDSIFSVMTDIFSLYTSQVIFGCVLGIWALRRVVKLFHLL